MMKNKGFRNKSRRLVIRLDTESSSVRVQVLDARLEFTELPHKYTCFNLSLF